MILRLLPLIVLLLAALAGCSRQESAWGQAERQDSVAGYETYLRDYPAGAHAQDARTRLADRREQQEWDRALRFNTPEAFQRYLSGYPEGRFAEAARERLSDFLLARVPGPEPQPAAAQPVAPAVPAGKLIQAAAPAGAGDYYVQLGAFAGGEAAADRAWKDLSARHADLLGGLTPRTRPLERSSGRLWRLQAGPLGEARAREICTVLKSRGAACLLARG